MRTIRLSHLLPLLAAGALGACSDSTSPKSGVVTHPVSLSLTTRAATGAASFAAAGPAMNLGVTIGAGDLVITRAQLVLRDVKLEGSSQANDAACTSRDSAETEHEARDSSETESHGSDARAGGDASIMASHGADDTVAETEHHECGEMRLGPMLVDLPLDSTTTSQVASVPLPEGSYSEMKFHLHAPNALSPRDTAFIRANPSFDGASVRVDGTYRGQPFTWSGPVNATLKMEFSPPFVVAAGGSNVTLSIDIGHWFTDAGGNVIDPSTAGPGTTNGETVRSNIRASFHAFHDDDRNGRDDAHEHSGGDA